MILGIELHIPSDLEAGDQIMKKIDARNKLKEAKENLELELITQEEYDALKEELKPIIISKDEN